ncbi:MAG TPA: ankyrin repeat domain-containing protein [Bryobacteraceae bacterium]|nr:ankyrin repeat domain-containing protein [Bryobacteraceae bacterium]
MSDALALPRRPDLEQYRKLAKDLQRACKSAEPGAVRAWAAHWLETLEHSGGREVTPESRRQIDWRASALEQHWRKVPDAGRCALTKAQFFIARAHGFASWPKFTGALEQMARAHSPVSQFEEAADAIVSGDIEKLRTMLRENGDLARARSTREHRSTLLHYVSANGIEDFRQKTPQNVVEITKVLLEAGADVNAESEAYGGRSTALGLAATSCHPEEAGVQLPLMELLLSQDARMDPGAVNSCLHNGRKEAAELLADRGASLDLEAAAGVGRLDVVQSFFTEDGRLIAPATPKQMTDGFAWACEFGRTAVVDFLLQRGIETGARLPHHGQTGLHWAAYGANVDTVKLLLERGAAVDARDPSFDGTPLGWALYQWGNSRHDEGGSYYETVRLLVRAGAKLDAHWLEEDDPERQRALRKLGSDARMQAALRGRRIGAGLVHWG